MPPLFVIRKGVECFLHACHLGKFMNSGRLHTEKTLAASRGIKCKTLERRLMRLRFAAGALSVLCGSGCVAKQIADKTIQSVLAAWSGVREMWCVASVAQLDRASDF